MAQDKLLAEMQALRDRVTGITGTAVASRDGLIIREDTGGVDPDNLAALTSAALVLLGDEGLDITRLHRESRSVVDNLEKLLALGQRAAANRGVEDLRGVRDRDVLAALGQGGGDLKRAARVGRDQQRGPGGLHRFGLAGAQLAGRLGLQQVVHARRTAAGARVRHLDQGQLRDGPQQVARLPGDPLRMS